MAHSFLEPRIWLLIRRGYGTARGRVLIRSVFGGIDDTEAAIMGSWARHRTYSVYGSRETWSKGPDVN